VQIAIAVFDQFTALDAVGPYQVLAELPQTEVVTVATRPGPVRDDRSLTFQAAAAFDEVTEPDVIVVPGGLITRRMVRDHHPVIDWIAAVHPTATWTTSVCTGAVLLAAAGVLTGRSATTHWIAYDQLTELGATPTDQRVVVDGDVVTAAGVSAGIDMALTLADRIGGATTAQAIQLGIEYDPQPPFDAGAPRKAGEAVRVPVAQWLRRREADLLA